MKTVNEAFHQLVGAREDLKKFNATLTLEQATQIAVGDETTVEVFALRNTQSILLDNIMKAEQEYADAKKEDKTSW